MRFFIVVNAFVCRGEKEIQAELPGVSTERHHCSAASSGESHYFVHAGRGCGGALNSVSIALGTPVGK